MMICNHKYISEIYESIHCVFRQVVIEGFCTSVLRCFQISCAAMQLFMQQRLIKPYTSHEKNLETQQEVNR